MPADDTTADDAARAELAQLMLEGARRLLRRRDQDHLDRLSPAARRAALELGRLLLGVEPDPTGGGTASPKRLRFTEDELRRRPKYRHGRGTDAR